MGSCLVDIMRRVAFAIHLVGGDWWFTEGLMGFLVSLCIWAAIVTTPATQYCNWSVKQCTVMACQIELDVIKAEKM